MNGRTKWRLAGMMALIYGIQGAFWPLLAVHLRDLGVDGRGRGWIFATLAIGSVATPLGVGRLVDQLLAAQHFMALAQMVGCVLLGGIAWGVPGGSLSLFAWFLAYWLVVAPTMSVGATIALRNLERPTEEFGQVRLWGTVGWMLVGWLVSAVLVLTRTTTSGQLGTAEAFWIGVGLSLLLVLYSFTLPHTPPLAGKNLGDQRARSKLRDGFEVLAKPGVLVYLITAFGVCMTTPYVYQVLPTHLEAHGLSRRWIPTVMTLGQIPEIAALAVLPWLFRRFRFKWTLALGIGSLIVRFGSLVVDPPLWVMIAGIPLHGISIACFVVGGQVFIDSRASADRRAGAQALLTVVTSGVGVLCGSLLAGETADWFPGGSPLVFLIPCLVDLALLLGFSLTFQPGEVPWGHARHDLLRSTASKPTARTVPDPLDPPTSTAQVRSEPT